MRLNRPMLCGGFVFLTVLLSRSALSAEYATETIVRGGCPDEIGCCSFGESVISKTAPVYSSEEATEKIGTFTKGKKVITQAGRVETSPGKVEVLVDHDPWKKGDVIGLYSNPDPKRRTRIGVSPRISEVDDAFLANRTPCAPATKDCWGKIRSYPKFRWWIKAVMDDRKDGWVEAKYFESVGNCGEEKKP